MAQPPVNFVHLPGFGCRTDNCVLAFLQDNFFPCCCCGGGNPEDIDRERRQRSWRRRVDVNMGYYLALMIIFSGREVSPFAK